MHLALHFIQNNFMYTNVQKFEVDKIFKGLLSSLRLHIFDKKNIKFKITTCYMNIF